MTTRTLFSVAGLSIVALACHTRTIDGSQRSFGGPAAQRPASVAVLGSGFDPDTLVTADPAAEHEHHHEHGAVEAGEATYTCPHHPEVRASAPGKCPKCHMDLVPQKRASDTPAP